MGVAEKVRPINLSSVNASVKWGKPIGLLLIDGDHNKAGVDLEIWLPYVFDGGLVAMHDNNLESVSLAVSTRKELQEIETADRTTVYRKVG